MKLARWAYALAALVAILAAVTVTQAQSGTSAIFGRISDTQQLALPRSTVDIRDAQGNAVRSMIADGEGGYQFNNLPAGSYTLRVTLNGFEAAEKPVRVAEAENLALDVTLQPQSLTQTITVAGSLNDRPVAAKADIPLQLLPLTVNTVPQELIQQQASTDIVSVLNNVPGANAFTEYGVYNYFIFRGFQMDKDPGSAVLLNGMRVEGNRINSQINSIESVEVLKGPASMLYGTEATGGTINIVEKQPLDTPRYELVLRGSRWDTGGIEFGATGPLRSKNILYRLDTAYLHSEGFRGAGYDRFNITPKIYTRLGPRDRLNFNLNYNLDRFGLDAGIPLLNTPANAGNYLLANIVPNIPLDRRFNTPGNYQHGNSPIFQAFYDHSFSDRMSFRQSFEFQHVGDEYWQSEFLFVDPIASPHTVDRGYLYFNHMAHNIVSQSELLANFHFGFDHRFLIGYEYDNFDQRTKRSTADTDPAPPSIDLFNPVETAPKITSFPPRRFDGFRNRSNAVYFQDFVQLHPKLQLLFGGRYDDYNRTSFRNPVVAGIETKGPTTEFNQNPFTYRVGLNVQALPSVSLYTSYATTFEAQTALSATGQTFDPETGSQFEAGAKINLFQNRVTATAAFYHIIQENIVVERPNGDLELAGQQYAKGAELEIRARASQRLNVFANYGFTQSAFDDFNSEDGDGAVLQLRGFVPGLVPRHTARLWTNYELPRGFDVSAGSRYISKRSADQFDHFFMGGFTTWDAAVRYRRERFEASVNFMNVLNKTHYFISAIDDTQIYPGPPIDVAVTLRYRF